MIGSVVSMADLSLKASHDFWFQYPDPSIFRVLAFMESVEDFVLDNNPDIEQALSTLTQTLSNIGAYDIGQQEAFVTIGANLKMSRTLCLLQTLDTAYPGSASRVLVHSEENTRSPADICGFFLRRNVVFERLRLISRVFAPDRVSLVIRALEGEDV